MSDWWDPIDDDDGDAESRRQTELLATLAADQGVGQLPEQIRARPREHSTVPPDTDYNLYEDGWVEMPSGTLTIDWQSGRITHDHDAIPNPLGSPDDLTTLDDMSRSLDEMTASMRSISVQADNPVRVRLDGQDWLFMDPHDPLEVGQREFTKTEIQSDLTARVRATAATTADPPGISQHAPAERWAETTVTPDLWTPVPVSTFVLDFSYGYNGNDLIQIDSHDEVSVTIKNNSSEQSVGPNPVDARLVASNAETGTMSPVEIARTTGIADGDHAIFDVDSRHKLIGLEVTNQSDGETVGVETDVIAGGR